MSTFRWSLVLAVGVMIVIFGAALADSADSVDPRAASFTLCWALVAFAVLVMVFKQHFRLPAVAFSIGLFGFIPFMPILAVPGSLAVFALSFAVSEHEAHRSGGTVPELRHIYLSQFFALLSPVLVFWTSTGGNLLTMAVSGVVPLLIIALLEVDLLRQARHDLSAMAIAAGETVFGYRSA